MAPAGVACIAAMAASAFGGGLWRGLGMPVYCFAAVVVGSLSMGHEYTDRTLGLLLSQPVRRQRLLFDKLLATASVLLVLLAAAGVFVLNVSGPGTFNRHPAEWTAALILPVLCGLFLAPWLTMVSRSAIAGIVFTIAIPGLLFAAGEIIGTFRFGRGDAADALITSILWPGTLILCAVGAVATWHTFMQLEAAEARGADVRLPQWLSPHEAETGARGVSKHSRVWLLVAKELRLQQMTFTVAGLYLVAAALAPSARHVAPAATDLFNVLTPLYSGLIALLAGSLSCAEERQMRTLEPQMLLPLAMWRQWSVKLVVVLSLALLLALGLPALLERGILLRSTGFSPDTPWRSILTVPVVLLALTGVYVSSLCASGVSALLVSIPASLGAVLFVRVVAGPLQWAVSWASPPVLVFRSGGVVGHERSAVAIAAAAAVSAIVFVLLRFALTNYRSGDRSRRRVVTQVLWLATCAIFGLTLLAGVARFYESTLG